MPETTVAAIIKILDNGEPKVLLTKRNVEPFIDMWCLPGGHIDNNESAKDAVIREVKEETGLEFDAQFFNYFDEIIPDKNIHAVVIVFEGIATGTLSYQINEVSKIKWCSIDEARSIKLAFTHNEILDKYAPLAEKGK